MSRANKKDQRLPTGAIVYWSRMFKRSSLYYVPVWCPDCEEERVVKAGRAAEDSFTGICKKCLNLRRRAAAPPPAASTPPRTSAWTTVA